MRVTLLNTGTELLAGDVQDTHLGFHRARDFCCSDCELRNGGRSATVRLFGETLRELFSRAEIIFVTGGLGPTSDDITRDVTAELLGLNLEENDELLASLKTRLKVRGIKWVPSIARQAQVPAGAQVLPNENGSAPGLYLKANINSKHSHRHIFFFCRVLRANCSRCSSNLSMPLLRSIIKEPLSVERRFYKIAVMGESIIEEKIGQKILAIPGVELGYCARPGEVDLRMIGPRAALEQAEKIVRAELGDVIFTDTDAALEEVLVKLLTEKEANAGDGGIMHGRFAREPNHKCSWRFVRPRWPVTFVMRTKQRPMCCASIPN